MTKKPTAGYADRLGQALKYGPRPMSVRRLANELGGGRFPGVRGTSYGGVRQYAEGKVINPRTELLRAMGEVLGVRGDWLAFGSGEMLDVAQRRAQETQKTAAARLAEWRSARGLNEGALVSLNLGSAAAVQAVMRADDTLEYAGLGDEDRLHVLATALRGLVAAEAAFDLREGAANYPETLALRTAVRDPRGDPASYALWADQVVRAFLGCVRGLGVPLSRRERTLRDYEMLEVEE